MKKDKVKAFETFVGEKHEEAIGYKASFYEAEIDDGIIVEKII